MASAPVPHTNPVLTTTPRRPTSRLPHFHDVLRKKRWREGSGARVYEQVGEMVGKINTPQGEWVGPSGSKSKQSKQG